MSDDEVLESNSSLATPKAIGGAALLSLLLGGGSIGFDAIWDTQIDRIDGLEREIQVIEIYLEEAIVCQQALVLVHLEGDPEGEDRIDQCLGNAEMIRERLERIRLGASADGNE